MPEEDKVKLAEEGRVVFEATTDESHPNPLGGVHGGFASIRNEKFVSKPSVKRARRLRYAAPFWFFPSTS